MVQHQRLLFGIIGVFTLIHDYCSANKNQQALKQCSLVDPTWTGTYRRKKSPHVGDEGCVTIIETSCNCENRTLLAYFKKKIAGTNSTNFLEVSKELASSGKIQAFTNPKVFHQLNKELFHITTNRFLKPLTLENADLALQYYSGFIDTVLRSPQYSLTWTFCNKAKLAYERNCLAFKALEFLLQAPNKTKAQRFGWMLNITAVEDLEVDRPDTTCAITMYNFWHLLSGDITRQPLLLKVNMASLVTVEETPTGVDPACVNQKTTKTTHMNSKEGLTNEQLNELLRKNNCDKLTIVSSSPEENVVVLKEIVSSKYLRHEKVQSHLEITLLCISTAAVILAYGLLTLAARVKNSEKFYIHRSLLFSVGVGNLIFVPDKTLFSSRNDHLVLCSAIAVVQHYLHTAIFTWMFVEGINLYSKLVKVFDLKRPYTFYSAIGWGIPAFIAGVVAAISPSTFDMTDSETIDVTCGALNLEGTNLRTRCWMNGNLWIYKGPILAILLVNFVFYIIFLRVILGKLSSDHGNNHVIVAKKGLRSIIALLPLLGVTWLLGFFIEFHYAVAYIFIVLNSTQGIAFFIFHCVLDEQVRDALRKFLAKDGHNDKVKRARETPATNKPSHHTIPEENLQLNILQHPVNDSTKTDGLLHNKTEEGLENETS